MPACANCARELRPAWRFCVSCGMPTGVTSARPETKAIPIIPTPEPFAALREPVAAPPIAAPAPLPEPAPAPAEAPALLPSLDLVGTPVAATLADAHAPTLLVTDPVPETRSAPLRTQSRRRRSRRRVNALAVVSLVLGCLASPLAALFGHIALVQLTAAGERGRIPAIIAIVLGYGSLAFIIGLGTIYLVTHA